MNRARLTQIPIDGSIVRLFKSDEPVNIIITHPNIIGEDSLAVLIDRDKKTLSRLRKQGMPFFQEGRTIIYKVSEVLEWLGRHRADHAHAVLRQLSSKNRDRN